MSVPVEVAAWIIIASCVLPVLGWLLSAFVGWTDEVADIAADKPWKRQPWLEDPSLWEPYHPTSESTSDGEEEDARRRP